MCQIRFAKFSTKIIRRRHLCIHVLSHFRVKNYEYAKMPSDIQCFVIIQFHVEFQSNLIFNFVFKPPGINISIYLPHRYGSHFAVGIQKCCSSLYLYLSWYSGICCTYFYRENIFYMSKDTVSRSYAVLCGILNQPEIQFCVQTFGHRYKHPCVVTRRHGSYFAIRNQKCWTSVLWGHGLAPDDGTIQNAFLEKHVLCERAQSDIQTTSSLHVNNTPQARLIFHN